MKKGNVDILRLFKKVNSCGLRYPKEKTMDAKFSTMKVKLETGTKEFIKYLASHLLSINYSKIEKKYNYSINIKT